MLDRKHLIKTLLLVILVVFVVIGGVGTALFLWWDPGPEIVVDGTIYGRSFHLPPEYGKAVPWFEQTMQTPAFLDEIRQCCKDYPELMRTWTSETVSITVGIEPLGCDKVYVHYRVPVFGIGYTGLGGFFKSTPYIWDAARFPEVSIEAEKRNEEILKRVEEFLRRKIEELARTCEENGMLVEEKRV